jgi:hypothetical protein
VKLPIPSLSLRDQLAEFDIWITPSLGEIRDTDKFREELSRVTNVFEALGGATNQFATMAQCDPRAIADTFIDLVSGLDVDAAFARLRALASVLFLVTGKSDNNAKCQFPLYLRDKARWATLPMPKNKGVVNNPLPRELKADKYMAIVAGLACQPSIQKKLLEEFVSFVLSDKDYVAQMWSIGHSYFVLKACGCEKNLLTPLVVFQVRGSVSASGGHDPEDILRARLVEWGLTAGIDFNTSDVPLALLWPELAAADTRTKSRAYDFVLPYKTPGWIPRIFVQCQFYAGDSGSVSHKNVDQTASSRLQVNKTATDPLFLEYVDGAGYFSSLNGDLKNLLLMPTTRSFVQLRTASIRLRRELQSIGFLCPIEIEQAILRVGKDRAVVAKCLLSEGYAKAEVERGIAESLKQGILQGTASQISVSPKRRKTVRRYFLLDVVACRGSVPTEPKLSGSILIPGYGPFFAMKLDELAKHALAIAPSLKSDWSSPEVILGDIRWLCDEGLSMSC